MRGARGPVYGRHMADRLYGNTYRDFIMIMDSHTMFRDDWDTYMIKMWQSIDNEHAIITHYPWGSEHLERRFKCFDNPECDDKYSYHICGSYFEVIITQFLLNFFYLGEKDRSCVEDSVAHLIYPPFFFLTRDFQCFIEKYLPLVGSEHLERSYK